jgi:hypothetical protein
MIAALSPASANQAKQVTMYRLPIDLWSTEVIQPQTPPWLAYVRVSSAVSAAYWSVDGARGAGAIVIGVLTSGSGDRSAARRGPAARAGWAACATPGLTCCGSTIHPASAPRVLGSVPAAIVRRVARCVRSGPLRDAADVPVMAWHIAHWPVRNTSRPRPATESVGVFAGARCDATHCR